MRSKSEAERILESGDIPKDQFFLVIAAEAVSFAWSPCGNYLATGSGSWECALRVFDIRLRNLFFSASRHVESIFYLNWSPGGNYIVSGSHAVDPRLIVWKCDWHQVRGAKLLKEVSFLGEFTDLPPFPDFNYAAKGSESFGFYGFKKCAVSPD